MFALADNSIAAKVTTRNGALGPKYLLSKNT